MGEWKGPWKCEKCGRVFAELAVVRADFHWTKPIETGGGVSCDGTTKPYDRRAPDPRLAALMEALERIAWHEPTWKEARDIARATLAALEEKP